MDYVKLTPVTDRLTICEENYMSKEEVEKKTNKLNKKINKLQEELKYSKESYEKKIKKLEDEKWVYKVGDIVLYDNWRKVEITGLLDQKDFKYAGKFLDCKSYHDVVFRPEELTYYNHYTYEQQLLDKIWELKRDLEYRSKL